MITATICRITMREMIDLNLIALFVLRDQIADAANGVYLNLGAVLGSAWSDTEAVGINKSGDIFGFGDYQGKIQGFLLTPASVAAVSAIPGSATPVPEASTWAMLVVGFAGLGFAAYRGKQNNRCIE